MSKLLVYALFIIALFATGCSSCSKGGGNSDAPPPAPQTPFDEAFCKESLKRCLETIENAKGNYPRLNETRALCPAIPKGEVKFPLSDEEQRVLGAMANSSNCGEDVKACRDLRDKVVKHLAGSMLELGHCDKP